MPEREVVIDEDNLPNIQTEDRQLVDQPMTAGDKDEDRAAASAASYTSTGHKNLVQTAIWPAIAVLILMVSGLSIWNKMLLDDIHQQNVQLQDARERVEKLEQQLSTTDESVSQSSVAMQVKLKELNDRSDELWTQMDKLWASAWRRNQTEIVEHGEKLEKHSKLLKTADAKLAKLSERNNTFKADILALKAGTEEVAVLDQELERNSKKSCRFKETVKCIVEAKR